MVNKRKSQLRNAEHDYQKRSKLANSGDGDTNQLASTEAAQAQVDPTYGQRGAFPGLEDDNDEDRLFYGPASDGLEYLRMVRREAKSVSNLLIAPREKQDNSQATSGNEEQIEGTQGYYADGAYMAFDSSLRSSMSPNEHDLPPDYDMTEDEDPQEAYYESLGARFLDLRNHLRLPPPVDTLGDFSAAQTLASLKEASYDKLRYTFLYTTPSMRVLARMQQETIMRCLQYAETLLQRKSMQGQESGRNLGAWCWGLLAKCREVGEMTSDDVSVLRELGKKAVTLGRKMRSQSFDVQEVEEDENELEDKHKVEIRQSEEGEKPKSLTEPDNNPDDLELAKQEILQTLQTPTSHEHCHDYNNIEFRANATLDVIVTVVGMMYGQVDLLDARVAW